MSAIREAAGIKPKEIIKNHRTKKDQELSVALRKLRPHVADAIMAAVKIMKNEEAADQNKLKAATLILDNYRKIVLDIYAGEDQNPEDTDSDDTPVFSLKVVE